MTTDSAIYLTYHRSRLQDLSFVDVIAVFCNRPYGLSVSHKERESRSQRCLSGNRTVMWRSAVINM